MKKVLSVLLASFLIASSSVAFASGTVSNITNSRNNKSTVVTSFSDKGNMPAFRPGDSISFDLTGLTADDEVTLISSLSTDGNISDTLSDNTVQFINQYRLSGSTKTVTYVVRDLTDGIYVLKINDGTGVIATFYYKVGSVDVDIVNDGSPYVSCAFDKNNLPVPMNSDKAVYYSVGFIASATIDSADVSFSDVGSTPGFRVTDGEKSFTQVFSDEALTALENFVNESEISGKFSVVYGVTVYNIPVSVKDNITAQAVVDAN